MEGASRSPRPAIFHNSAWTLKISSWGQNLFLGYTILHVIQLVLLLNLIPRYRKWNWNRQVEARKMLAIRWSPCSAILSRYIVFYSIWSCRGIIAFDIPNIGHGRRRWRLSEFKMAGWKPEVEITSERKKMVMRFKRLPHIFDYAGLKYATDDMARRRRHGKRKMAMMQTGSRNNFWTEKDATRFQRLIHIFDMSTKMYHWRHDPRSPDIGCFHFRFVWP